jgi:threonine aldolase
VIDLRSDWVMRPSEPMWAAMRTAEPDALPRLEAAAAELLGKEAAVWTPTCTAANLAALLTHCAPADRVALQPDAHILTTEGMGIAHVARLEPVDLDAADGAALVCLENTHTRAGGTLLSVEETKRLASLAPRAHLDGARLPNAAAALGVSLAALAAPADTVALSLNKGLGAPVGAVLAGDAAPIDEARVHLRRLGAASIHQAHVLAAAGLVALEDVDRVADDNRRAQDLARLIGAPEPPTNLIFVSLEGVDADAFLARLAEQGVTGYRLDDRRVRFVTHHEIDDAAVERAAAAVAAALDAAGDEFLELPRSKG